MAALYSYVFGGVLVLTVTVLLNTRPAEAVNCASADDCKNGGTCPSPNTDVCTCANSYKGDTCEDECAVGGDCGATGGSCAGTPMVCTCQDTAKKGPGCTYDCKVDGDCMNGGTCKVDAYPFTCLCGSYKGATCADECSADSDCGTGGTCETGTPRKCTCQTSGKVGPGCTKDGASALTGLSFMSLLVVLAGYLL